MAAKKRSKSGNNELAAQSRAGGAGNGGKSRRTRLRRSDEDKVRLVQQILASDNQSAEIKKLGIYPNQFYDWKKKYGAQLGGASFGGAGRKAMPTRVLNSLADEAKAFIDGKAALLERLQSQRAELDRLISELST